MDSCVHLSNCLFLPNVISCDAKFNYLIFMNIANMKTYCAFEVTFLYQPQSNLRALKGNSLVLHCLVI